MAEKIDNCKKKLERSLIKKALGYQYNEVITEYTVDENGEKLTKKKVTTKDVPPDLSAVKILLDELNVASGIDYSSLSDEELKVQMKNALMLLDEKYGGEDYGNKKT